MYYDLSSIPTNATVTSAKLRLFTFQLQAGTTFTGSTGKINTPWDLSSVNWNTHMSGAAYSYGSARVTGPNETWKEFDVTQIIQALVRSPATNYGFAFRHSGDDAADYYSSSFPDIVYRPRLIVTFEDGVDRVATPVLSELNPAFVGSMDLRVTCATAGAVVRYTTDGSEPSEASPACPSVLTLDQTAHVRTRAFLAGKQPSTIMASYCQKVGGLAWKRFPVGADVVPNLDGLTPDSTGTIHWPMEGQWASQVFRVRFEGYLNIPASGDYRFTYNAVYGKVRLLIDGLVKSQADGSGGEFGMNLTAGPHRLVLDVLKKVDRDVGLQLEYLRGTSGNVWTPVPPSWYSISVPTSVTPDDRRVTVHGAQTARQPSQSLATYTLRGERLSQTSHRRGMRVVAGSTDGYSAGRLVLHDTVRR